ncbi:MAG TPA: FtsX-like permease family protein [Terriglobia bacterium]|nr:FtsX-like permease family protein [Terriglobia bacterium]
MALGANPRQVMGMVVRQGMTLTLIGIAIGIVGAFGATRSLSFILYQVTATDPATFVGVSVLFALVAIAACYVPARRAIHVDPMVALRHE